MIEIGKIADLVLLMVGISFCYESPLGARSIMRHQGKFLKLVTLNSPVTPGSTRDLIHTHSPLFKLFASAPFLLLLLVLSAKCTSQILPSTTDDGHGKRLFYFYLYFQVKLIHFLIRT